MVNESRNELLPGYSKCLLLVLATVYQLTRTKQIKYVIRKYEQAANIRLYMPQALECLRVSFVRISVPKLLVLC